MVETLHTQNSPSKLALFRFHFEFSLLKIHMYIAENFADLNATKFISVFGLMNHSINSLAIPTTFVLQQRQQQHRKQNSRTGLDIRALLT